MIKISVIIPTWCEAGRIAQAIDMARAVGDEIIVADAGSPNSTGEVARSHGAQVELDRSEALGGLRVDVRFPP